MRIRNVATGLLLVLATGAAWSQTPPWASAPVTLSQPSYQFDTADNISCRSRWWPGDWRIPFSLALLPNGDALISERGGQLRLLRNAIGAEGKPTTLEAAPVPGLPTLDVKFRNAGLHDIALHPDFATNPAGLLHLQQAGKPDPGRGQCTG